MAICKVTTTCGILRGQPAGNHYVSVFKGIPYAAPPVGPLRWRPPQPPEAWEGERDALTFSRICPQPPKEPGSFYWKEYFPIYEECSEDCLYLNVWTSAITGKEKMPVFVWIHGGGFKEGYGHTMGYDGEAYAAQGIVTVTINYRVGLFGFLTAPELAEESPCHSCGNYGILDQIAALHWVQENIAAFGGDPEQVTIGGQSAGALSTQILSCSPLTKGLFQRAILQSGGGIYSLYDTPFDTWQEAAAKDDLHQVLEVSSIEEARRLPAEEIARRQLKQPYWNRGYLPVVDGVVLPADPNRLVYEGCHHDIDYLIGSTRDEGLPTCTLNREEYRRHMEILLGEQAAEYLSLCPIEDEESFLSFRAQLMQENLRIGTSVWCRLQEVVGRRPSYLYQFNRSLPGNDHLGAVHSAEHWYVFRTFLRSWRPMEETDFRLSITMSSYWMNFIRTGNPNGSGLPAWSPYTEATPCRMELGDTQECLPLVLSPREKWQADRLIRQGNAGEVPRTIQKTSVH
ncbi:MAG: carboxylesterase family protein [Lachnospiraceae bacterium]|nr:carboxylesterase family protein [Lachnospiraceae bacterium]